jgi:hypothetical protein
MLERTQAALGWAGVDDKVVAAAMFLPRGHFGGAFAGGLIGDSVAGGVGGPVGALAGMHAVLELVDGAWGAAIELEGPRLPGFHAGDVIDALRRS